MIKMQKYIRLTISGILQTNHYLIWRIILYRPIPSTNYLTVIRKAFRQWEGEAASFRDRNPPRRQLRALKGVKQALPSCKCSVNTTSTLNWAEWIRDTWQEVIFLSREKRNRPLISSPSSSKRKPLAGLVRWSSHYLKFALLRACKLISLAPLPPIPTPRKGWVAPVGSDGFRSNYIFPAPRQTV